MSIKGAPSNQAEIRHAFEHATVEPVRLTQNALSVLAHSFVRKVGSDAVEAGSTEKIINATAHSAQRGDIIYFRSGALDGHESKVWQVVDANSFELAEELPSAPVAAVTFDILRHKFPTIDDEGNISVTASSGPAQFVYGGSATDVEEDTATPANSRPLPIKALDGSGAEVDFATEAKQDTQITAIGAVNEAAPASDTANSGLNGRLQRIAQRLTSLIGLLPTSLGQKTAANSLAVVLASDNDIASETTLASVLGAVDAVETKLDTLITQTDALEGHLDGVEGSLTNIDAGTAAALGQTTMSASVPVVIASDQSTLTVSETTSGTATVTSVAGAATSTTILASNANRKGATFYNDSTATLYLKLGSTASTSSFTVKLESNDYYELPQGKIYTGAIDGIWSSATGNVRITELT